MIIPEGRSIDLAAVERYLHEHIPITRHMGVCVTDYDGDKVRLAAPLASNLNHRSTAFGGSLSSLGILAGWTLLHIKMLEAECRVRLVIQHSEMDFTAPAHSDFAAECRMPDTAAWRRFKQALDKRGRGRLALAADLWADGIRVGRHHGTYVAVCLD
jgi:thioesterase domain-containing protein